MKPEKEVVFKGSRIRRKHWAQKNPDIHIIWFPKESVYKHSITGHVFPVEVIDKYDDWEIYNEVPVETRLVYIKGFDNELEGLAKEFSQKEEDYDPYDVVIAICLKWGMRRKRNAIVILRKKEDKSWYQFSAEEDDSWAFESSNPIHQAKKTHPLTLLNKIANEGLFGGSKNSVIKMKDLFPDDGDPAMEGMATRREELL